MCVLSVSTCMFVYVDIGPRICLRITLVASCIVAYVDVYCVYVCLCWCSVFRLFQFAMCSNPFVSDYDVSVTVRVKCDVVCLCMLFRLLTCCAFADFDV